MPRAGTSYSKHLWFLYVPPGLYISVIFGKTCCTLLVIIVGDIPHWILNSSQDERCFVFDHHFLEVVYQGKLLSALVAVENTAGFLFPHTATILFFYPGLHLPFNTGKIPCIIMEEPVEKWLQYILAPKKSSSISMALSLKPILSSTSPPGFSMR